MRSRIMFIVSVLAVVVAVGAGQVGQPASAAPIGSPTGTHAPTKQVCAAAPANSGRFACMAVERTTSSGAPLTAPADVSLPPGYGPIQIQSAYQLTTAAAARGGDQTVAVVDAFDDPSAESDLAKYRSTYGLPACAPDDGCFRKVNQNGDAAPLPQPDQQWSAEISLDLDMISATCPKCHILLVESDDDEAMNLGASVATAAKLGAKEISNSWGAPEFNGEADMEPFFDQPGVMITASSGDSGYGVNYPAASAYVTAVGGTSLWPSSASRGWTETAWAGAGSGCSAQIRKPAWQHDACAHRTVSDVSAVADPDTPVAAYDTYGMPGWVRMGGTSAASPIVASVYALIGNATGGGSYFYQHRNDVFDITAGADGTCSPRYLCGAESGYDGPTGLGTPDLTGAQNTEASCVNGWSATPQQPSPTGQDVVTDELLTQDRANAIAALSPSNVWTVGTYQDEYQGPGAAFGFATDVTHWNGSTWSKVPSPTPITPAGTANAVFNAVSFDSPKDGWAVGLDGNNREESTPLAAHWDGSRWSMSPVLNPWTTPPVSGPYAGYVPAAEVDAVTAIAPNDVWIGVGSPTNDAAAFEHWDGTTWRVIDVPPGDVATNAIAGMHAFSATNIWAVGQRVDPTTRATSDAKILHWDGQAWSYSQPDPATTNDAGLFSISGDAPDDIWAVGQTVNAEGTLNVPLIEHWDGTSWKLTPTVDANSVAGLYTTLAGVVALSPTDAWAVGAYDGHRAGQTELQLNLLEHWDGHTWTLVSTPQTAVPDGLRGGISASSAGNIWIAGSQQLSTWNQFTDYPWILRNGCSNG